MNWITFGIGIAALLYGFYTIYARIKSPSKFGKLEAMQQSLGKPIGTIIHVISYTIAPIAFGISMIIGGLNGLSFFGD